MLNKIIQSSGRNPPPYRNGWLSKTPRSRDMISDAPLAV